MYVLNKIVGGMLNPISIALLFVLAGVVCGVLRRRRVALGLLVFAFSWLWVWGTALWCRAIGLPLERQFQALRAEDTPTADAIVVLGGGMTANKAVYPYADISEAGDRVWHAARLYRAGKAPLVVPTGCNDKDAVVPLLLDLGVPSTALRVEDEARNTEENARFVATMLKDVVPGRKPRILLVTSAIHMRRALLMYSRYASELEIIPVATDFHVTVCTDRPIKCSDFFPNTDYLQKNGCILKELVGYWGYRLLRR